MMKFVCDNLEEFAAKTEELQKLPNTTIYYSTMAQVKGSDGYYSCGVIFYDSVPIAEDPSRLIEKLTKDLELVQKALADNTTYIALVAQQEELEKYNK